MSKSTMLTDRLGNKYWKNSKGKLHRTGGPAAELSNGDKEWCVNGKLHRLNGPAIERSDGEKAWYVNDKFLGYDNKGFWKLWDTLTPEQKQDPVLLSYLPVDFNV